MFTMIMSQDLEKLYSVIQNNLIFTEKQICETCPRLCSREQKWHWLLPEEIVAFIKIGHLSVD